MLIVIVLIVVCHYAECNYAMCHYAECCGALHGANLTVRYHSIVCDMIL
jgi:hypothetical protein